MVDQEVKELLDESYASALSILREHRSLLDEVAEFLLVKETITGEELMSFVNSAEKSAAQDEEKPQTEE